MKKFFTALAIVAAISLTAYPVIPALHAREAGIVQQVDYYEAADDSSAIIAAILSVIIPGLGQVYLGYIGRGAMIFLGFIVLEIVAGIMGVYIYYAGCILDLIAIVFWIWQIGDAYKLGLKKARHYRRHRRHYDEDEDEEDEDYDEDEDSMLTPHFTPAYVVTE